MVGVLVEKQHTVPDAYPLTLNALVGGCNQKTSRDPVMEATDAQVQAALDRLKSLALVVESSGGRVMRYAHNAGKALGLPPQSIALLAVLFLRGPQTAGELRIHTERLHRFGDILSVQAFLEELGEKGFVRELARAPGARESRWMHLLSGDAPPAVASAVESDTPAPTLIETAALRAEIDRLHAQLAQVQQTLARVCRELGIEP